MHTISGSPNFLASNRHRFNFRPSHTLSVKVSRVKLYPVTTKRRSGIRNRHVIVRIDTDNDWTGWGEMSDLSHLPAWHFHTGSLERTLMEALAGHDPRNLARLEGLLLDLFPVETYLYSRSASVRQGVDIALHDLVAKTNSQPVHDLLGGRVRDAMDVCLPIFRMQITEQVQDRLKDLAWAYDLGFRLVRIYVGACPEADHMLLKAMAETYGNEMRVKSWDFSGSLHWKAALAASEALSEYGTCQLIESPAPALDLDGLREFRNRSRLPVSEHVLSQHHAWQLLHGGCVDSLNVSPFVLGGLRPCQRVMALAESAHAGVLLGTTQELAVGTAAIAHLAASAQAVNWPGDCTGPLLYEDDVVVKGVTYQDGALVVPDDPGLGVTVSESRLEVLATPLEPDSASNLTALRDRTAA